MGGQVRGRLRAGQWLAISVGLLGIAAVVGLAIAFSADHHLADRRRALVDRIDPAATATQQLYAAALNQETGLRGFIIGGTDDFLEPYRLGERQERAALTQLDAYARRQGSPRVTADLAEARRRLAAWQDGYAAPTIGRVRRVGPNVLTARDVTAGKARFDFLRAGYGTFARDLAAERAQARRDVASAANRLDAALVIAALLLLASFAVSTVVVRRIISAPINALSRQVRGIAQGDFGRPIASSGPRDIVELGLDVESMRERIVHELEAVRAAEARVIAQAADLERSNAELEQFAYVASHDLQEPLRKVASFCQMLERRYSGQLDDRADQYIAFAVDGAKRMQVLINDLLAFSRVGRVDRPHEQIDTGALAAEAVANLGVAQEEAGARIEIHGPLPTVSGDRTLLAMVFQNLIANAIKFHAEEQPVVDLSVFRRGDEWEFTVADNGIGIDPQYAEKIFVIFQRLHTKDVYGGTGIGLAMCRKVIEFHGGRIWLDEDAEGAGATFHFTLPSTSKPRARPPALEPAAPQPAPLAG